MPDTRTVSELESAGFTHIEARCCSIVCLPFRLMKLEGQVNDSTTYEQIALRLRCKTCGKPPEQIRPWRQYIDEPEGPMFATWGQMPPDLKPKKPGT